MSSESNRAILESPDASDAIEATSTADAYATWKAAVIAEAKGEKSYPPSEKSDLEWAAGLPAGTFDVTVKLLRARFQGAANAESRRGRER